MVQCLCFLLVFAVSTSAAAAPTELASHAGIVQIGKPMPGFAGLGLDDNVISLKRLLAAPAPRAVLVSFMATWCVPCRVSLPVLKRASALGGVRLLLVDVGEEAERILPFLEENGLAGQAVLVDRFAGLAKRLFAGEVKLPRTFMVDGQGTVRTILVSEGDDLENVLSRELSKVVVQ